MVDTNDQIAALSPAQRALFELRLEKEDAVGAPVLGIPRQANCTSAPLSFAQQRLWFLDQLEPSTPASNRPAPLRLTGALNKAALEQSLSEIVHRHDALRTTFSVVDGQPVQRITPSNVMTLPVVDLSHLSGCERTNQVERLAAEEAQRPFDLTHGPLLRASLLRLDSQEHILLLAIHHITFDGWSMTLLCEELAALYEAFCAGRSSPLPELPLQYADFAVWQRQQLHGETPKNQLLYWRQQLSGAPAGLELPTDRPRPAVQTFQGARHSRLLPKALCTSLQALSQQEGVTLFITLLAAFKVLLHRYTGQTDIIVGSPIAGRTCLELERLIGLFVNMLALRTDLSGNPSFRELLERVRQVTLGAYANQELPFEQLVEELQPQRDVSRPPLFQVTFQLRNIPTKAVESLGLKIEEYVCDPGVARFDLSLDIEERADGLWCVFDYNTALFDTATIERMMGHFETLVKGIVAHPDQSLSALPVLTDAERQQLLVEGNATTTAYPTDQCLPQLFETQVAQTPEAIAVVCEDAQLSYRELNARANQLAHYLRQLGVGPETLVGICVERSVEMIVGLLGILKAGGAFVPLDPASPPERLAFMLKDAKVRVLLIQERLIIGLPEHKAQVVCLDTGWEAIAQAKTENPVSSATVENIAYVLYTSGSTGQPKGVMIEHRSLVNYLHWVNKNLLGDTMQCMPLTTKLSFDACLKQLFAPLLRGSEVWILSEEVLAQPAALLTALATRTKVGLNCVPSLWKGILDTLHSADAIMSTASLTCLFVGGEQLDKELVIRSFSTLPHLHIWNLYGPTEATANASMARILSANEVTIGRPIANTQLYVLDGYLQPVPVGVPGELHIGGTGLARGYLNQPQLTAEKFIPHPFSTDPNARLYKTGDLARYRPDGNIEFLGRSDQQVKLRGFRIELGEIEAILGQHQAVREAVVLAREDTPGDKRLVAYVAPHPASGPTVAELRKFLKAKLPEYMVPATFVLLDMLPLTPNGKVDRRALPVPDQSRPELKEAWVAPRTPVEEGLVGIWASVLGLKQVGIHDNFFELEGHSLKATQVMSRVHHTFHVELPLRTLFETPTIAGLAEAVEQAQRNGTSPLSAIVPTAREAHCMKQSSLKEASAREKKG